MRSLDHAKRTQSKRYHINSLNTSIVERFHFTRGVPWLVLCPWTPAAWEGRLGSSSESSSGWSALRQLVSSLCARLCCAVEGDGAPLVCVPLYLPRTQFQMCLAVSYLFTSSLSGELYQSCTSLNTESKVLPFSFSSVWCSSTFLLCLFSYRFATPDRWASTWACMYRYLCSYRLDLCFWKNHWFPLTWFLRRFQGKTPAVKSLKCTYFTLKPEAIAMFIKRSEQFNWVG